jgi:RimJ/RimL family protein N-acetyltransferase
VSGEIIERLEGQAVVLAPLAASHEQGLYDAAQPPEIWSWLTPIGESPELFAAWFQTSLEASQAGREGVFATLDRATGQPIGSTRYLNIRPEHRGLEIGWTWLTPSAWRTGANIEAKLMMLEYAFERLDCLRVEFKTDSRNERSRGALAALPVHAEGVLRQHMIVPGIGLRDSAYFSVIDAEWPAVRANLRQRVAAARSRQS